MVRLKCPNCANVIDAPAGSTPRCPACGFVGAAVAAPATASPFSPLETPGQPTPTARPGWTTTAMVLMFVSGGFAALAGLVLLIGGGAIARFVPSVGGDIAGSILMVIGVVLLVFATLYLLLASQVGRGREWARVTTLVLAFISGTFNLFGLLTLNPMSFFGLAFDVLVIVGLMHPTSRAWFAHQERSRVAPGFAPA